MRRFRSSCVCAKHYPGLCSAVIYSVASNDSVMEQRRPRSDCADAQSDLGLRCSHMTRRHISLWVLISVFVYNTAVFLQYPRFLTLLNKKEGNDHESIQSPNTFHPRHQRERWTHLMQRHNNQNTTSRKPKGQFPNKIKYSFHNV